MSTVDMQEKSETGQEYERSSPLQDSRSAVMGAVEETKQAEASLSEKVEALSGSLEGMSEEAQARRRWQREDYISALESLKAQVEDIKKEWNSVSDYVKAERQRVESLLQSFPGIIELSTLHAQTLRLNHLEQLVSELFQEAVSYTHLTLPTKRIV